MKSTKAYWVPEDFLFESAGDCLDARPDDGAAALVYCNTYVADLEAKCAELEMARLNYEGRCVGLEQRCAWQAAMLERAKELVIWNDGNQPTVESRWKLNHFIEDLEKGPK